MEEDPADKGFWITTLPSGERIATQAAGGKVPVKGAQVCVASDPQTGQVGDCKKHILCSCFPGTVLQNYFVNGEYACILYST